jgi:hypothetical protein
MSLGHLVLLTLFPFILFIKEAVYVPPLATTLPEIARRI